MGDIVVYGQADLEKALKDGAKNIILCAGLFRIPKAPGVRFGRLGPVTAEVLCGREEARDAGMVFDNVCPAYFAGYAIESRAARLPTAAMFAGSGSGSFLVGSGSGSFLVGSGSGGGSFSYEYEFEYEYELGSFRGSGGSFSSSYGGSYSLSYSMPVSVSGSFAAGSFTAGSFAAGSAEYEARTVRVFGYGIDLI